MLLRKPGYLFFVPLLLISISMGCSRTSTDPQTLSPKTNQSNTTPQSPSTAENVPSPSSPGEIINNFTLAIEKRTVKKNIINDYHATIDYDLNFVQLTGSYKGIGAINKYYDLKEKTVFFGKEYNDYLNVPNSLKDYNLFLKANYHVEVQVGDILSISGDGDSWAGGVSNPTLYSDVFDLNTGEKLSLDDVFKVRTNEYLNLIYDEVTKCINKEISKGNNRYNFNDAYTEDGQAAIKKEFKPDNFYLTEKFLVVFYPKYSLGAGAAGTFKFEIPLDSIEDTLKIEPA